MSTQAPSPTPTESPPTTPPDAGVIEDARLRQKRHRRAGACLLLAIAAATVIVGLGGGGGGAGSTHSRPTITTNDRSLVQGVFRRLAHGSSTTRFTITAPSGHAYDVTMTARPASRLVLTMKVSSESSWTLNLPQAPNCATVARRARCTLHFSAGGNPGGRWTGIIHKTAPAAEGVRVSVVFSPHSGDFAG